MKPRWAGMAFGVLALAALLAFVFGRVAARGRFTGEYSSYGAGPSGTRALYQLASELGAQPARWSQDLSALPAHAMLVALGGCDAKVARSLSRYENDELVRFVEQGGVLLVAGARDYLPEKLGVSFAAESDCRHKLSFLGAGDEHDDDAVIEERDAGAKDASSAAPGDAGAPADAGTGAADGGRAQQSAAADAGPVSTITVDDAGVHTIRTTLPMTTPVPTKGISGVHWAVGTAEPLRGMSSIPLRRPGQLLFEGKQPHDVLLASPPADDHARIWGVHLARGRGHVIVLASASLFQNSELRTSEGGPLLARLLARYAPHGPLLFDEYHLGVGERRSVMMYLRQVGAMPFFLGLVVCVVLFLARAGARFGAARGPDAEPPRGTASFVAAMGQLYASANDPRAAIAATARRALTRIAAHHHVPPAAADALARELLARSQPTAAEAVREIDELQASAPNERAKAAAVVAAIDAALTRATQS